MNYFFAIKKHPYNKEFSICILGMHDYIQENISLHHFTNNYRCINAGQHLTVMARIKGLN